MTANLPPDEDIRQSLEAASQGPGLTSGEERMQGDEPVSDTLAETSPASRGWLLCRYTLAKCAMMAEKYPWQSLALLLITVACGGICPYFGWSILAGSVLYAANAEE